MIAASTPEGGGRAFFRFHPGIVPAPGLVWPRRVCSVAVPLRHASDVFHAKVTASGIPLTADSIVSDNGISDIALSLGKL